MQNNIKIDDLFNRAEYNTATLGFNAKHFIQEPNMDIRIFFQLIMWERKLGLSTHEKIVYLTLCILSEGKGYCCLGYERLAELCNISRETFTKCKKSLAQSRESLNGKPLILFESQHFTDGRRLPDKIKMVDIMPELNALLEQSMQAEDDDKVISIDEAERTYNEKERQ